MTTETGTDTTGPQGPRRRRRALSLTDIVLLLGALLGGSVLAYPIAAPWISDLLQGDAVLKYEQQTDEIVPEVRERMLADARTYNENLPNGPLRDPYVLNESGAAISVEAGRGDYERQLRVGDSDAEAPMARLTIPSIDVDLPILHSTDDDTLSRGVGHLYGSGLPVGGSGVHTVLTAHSGFVSSRLFDDLPQMRIGDVFTISVLGEVLTYRVDSIATTLPDESQLLRQIPGEDHVTLVTCTPRYVNTHRLLVRGVRIDTPPSDVAAAEQRLGGRNPGFPWWILIALGPAVLAGILIRPRRARAARPTSPGSETPTENRGSADA